MNTAYKKLVFSSRLVLYWLHIGLHENQTDKPIHEQHKTDVETRSARVFTGSGKKCGGEIEEAQTVIDVLTAEEVGEFPYENVAEALQCVSGVSISREFGEGERVSIRGAAPKRWISWPLLAASTT
jgi:outer membrane receptor for ferrienterochelin and colicin